MGDSFRPKQQGKTASPAFYQTGKSVRIGSNSNKDALGPVTAAWPIFAGVVVLGVGVIWFMREHDKVYTTPILSLTAPAFGQGAQASHVANLTNTLNRVNAIIEARQT